MLNVLLPDKRDDHFSPNKKKEIFFTKTNCIGLKERLKKLNIHFNWSKLLSKYLLKIENEEVKCYIPKYCLTVISFWGAWQVDWGQFGLVTIL